MEKSSGSIPFWLSMCFQTIDTTGNLVLSNSLRMRRRGRAVVFICVLLQDVGFLIQWRTVGGRETDRLRLEKRCWAAEREGAGEGAGTCYIRHSTWVLIAQLVSKVECLLGDEWECFTSVLFYYGFTLQRDNNICGRIRTRRPSHQNFTS